MAPSAKPAREEKGPASIGSVRSALRKLGRSVKHAPTGFLLDQISSSLIEGFLPTQRLPEGWSTVSAEDLSKRFLALAAPVSLLLRKPWAAKDYKCVQAIGKDYAMACRTLLELDGNSDQECDFVKFWINRRFQEAVGDVGLPTRREGGKVVKVNQTLDTGHILLPCPPSLIAAGFADRNLFVGKVAQLLRVVRLKTRRGDFNSLSIMNSFLMLKRGWSPLGIPSLVKNLVGHQTDLTREPEPLTEELAGAIRQSVFSVLKLVDLDKTALQKLNLPQRAVTSTCGVDGGANAALATLLGPVLTANALESSHFNDSKVWDEFSRRSTTRVNEIREQLNRDLLKERDIRVTPDVLRQYDLKYKPSVSPSLPTGARLNMVQLDSMENSAKREIFDKIETVRQLYNDVIDAPLLRNSVVVIPEDCKFRIITVGNAIVNASLATLHGHLQKCWAATPYYTGPNWEQRVLEWAPIFSVDGQLFIWHSVDYKSATDNLNRWSTHAASEAVLEKLAEFLPEDFQTFLGGATIDYPMSKDIKKAFEWTKDVYGQDVPPKLKPSINQTNGQLMGHTLSFPLLCMINLATLQLALKRVVRDGLMSQLDADKVMSRVLINGDDLLFAAPAWFVAYWEVVAKELGLTTTVGKSFSSPSFAMVNNVFYSMVSDPLQWEKGKRNRIVGYLNQAIIYGPVRGVPLEELTEADLDAVSTPNNYLGRTFQDMAETLPPGLASEYLDGFLRGSPWGFRYGSRIVAPHPFVSRRLGGLGLKGDHAPERWRDPKSVSDAQRAIAGACVTGRLSSLFSAKDEVLKSHNQARAEIKRRLPKPWPVISGLSDDSDLHAAFLTTQRLENDDLLVHCDCKGLGPFDPGNDLCPFGGHRCDAKLATIKHDIALRNPHGSEEEKTYKRWKQACIGPPVPKDAVKVRHLQKRSVLKMLETVPLTASECLAGDVDFLYPTLPSRMPNAPLSFVGSGTSLSQVTREIFPGEKRFSAYAQSLLFPNAFALPLEMRKPGVEKRHRHKVMQEALVQLGTWGCPPDEGLDNGARRSDTDEDKEMWSEIMYPVMYHSQYVLGTTGQVLNPGKGDLENVKPVTAETLADAEINLQKYIEWCVSRPIPSAAPLGLANLALPVLPPYHPTLQFGSLEPVDIDLDILPGGQPALQRPHEPFLLTRQVTKRRPISDRRLESAQTERFGPEEDRGMNTKVLIHQDLSDSPYIGRIGSFEPAVSTCSAWRMGLASFTGGITVSN